MPGGYRGRDACGAMTCDRAELGAKPAASPNKRSFEMLVLSRKSGQSFVIGTAKITVWTKGHTVKVGIEADRSIPVVRTELKQRKEGGK